MGWHGGLSLAPLDPVNEGRHAVESRVLLRSAKASHKSHSSCAWIADFLISPLPFSGRCSHDAMRIHPDGPGARHANDNAAVRRPLVG